MQILARIERFNPPTIALIGFVLIVLTGGIDYLTGYEFSFSVFYVFPIALVTWCNNRRLGMVAALASAGAWLVADTASGHAYTQPLIPIWNTLIRLTFFVIIVLLLVALKQALQREIKLARYDNLTGALNGRSFYQVAQRECDSLRRYRHAFTIAYIDLDDFKCVNDRLGHAAGDQVLRTVVRACTDNLRRADAVARLGGDEFVLLLPETDQDPARLALAEVRGILLGEMGAKGWPVTFSIGALTCRAAPHSVDELVRLADDLMYRVKRDGKNAITHATYDGPPT